MTESSVTHATFVIERTYEAPPVRVWKAFADQATKARWFHGPEEWGPSDHSLDFRVGGRETTRSGPPGGPVHTMDGVYRDIVPNERLVLAYDMSVDGRRISVSLTTVELEPAGSGTRMTFTEQGAYLDGYDGAEQREEGTRGGLDAIGAALEADRANV